jgi:hypothetical protein
MGVGGDQIVYSIGLNSMPRVEKEPDGIFRGREPISQPNDSILHCWKISIGEAIYLEAKA